MSQQWYVLLMGTELGPLSSAKLREMATTGQITALDQVRKKESEEWFPANSLKGLFKTDNEPEPEKNPSDEASKVLGWHRAGTPQPATIHEASKKQRDETAGSGGKAVGKKFAGLPHALDFDDLKEQQDITENLVTPNTDISKQVEAKQNLPNPTEPQETVQAQDTSLLGLSRSDYLTMLCTLALMLTIIFTRGDNNKNINSNAALESLNSWQRIVTSDENSIVMKWDDIRQAKDPTSFDSIYESLVASTEEYFRHKEVLESIDNDFDKYRIPVTGKYGKNELKLLLEKRNELKSQWQSETKGGESTSTIGLGSEANGLFTGISPAEAIETLDRIKKANAERKKQ